MNKSKALVKRVGVGLTKSKKQLERVLPKGMDVEKFIQQARTDLSRNPKLQKCNMGDLLTAYMEVAEWGLYPGQVLQEAYVLPFWDSNKNKMVPTVIPDWKGLVRKALEHRHVEDIRTGVICENDEYEILGGTANKLHHRRSLNNRGELVGAYAVADLASGKSTYEVLGRDDVESIRQSSKAPDSPAWTSWYNEMAKKSAVKRLVKRLPKTQNLAQILAADNQRTSTVGDDDVLDLETLSQKIEETPDVSQPGEGELDIDELEPGDASEPEDAPQAIPGKAKPRQDQKPAEKPATQGDAEAQKETEDEALDMAALERSLQKECQAQGKNYGQEWDKGMTGACLGLLRESFLDEPTESPRTLDAVKYALRVNPESELTDVKGMGRSTVKRLKKYFGLLEVPPDEDERKRQDDAEANDEARDQRAPDQKTVDNGERSPSGDEADYAAWGQAGTPTTINIENGGSLTLILPEERTWDGDKEQIYDALLKSGRHQSELYYDHANDEYGCDCTKYRMGSTCKHVEALESALSQDDLNY